MVSAENGLHRKAAGPASTRGHRQCRKTLHPASNKTARCRRRSLDSLCPFALTAPVGGGWMAPKSKALCPKHWGIVQLLQRCTAPFPTDRGTLTASAVAECRLTVSAGQARCWKLTLNLQCLQRGPRCPLNRAGRLHLNVGHSLHFRRASFRPRRNRRCPSTLVVLFIMRPRSQEICSRLRPP
jgi:hypothetical protein